MPAPLPNFNKMIRIIDEVFATRNDPNQIQVNPEQLKKLQAISPLTLSEVTDENGPVIWLLMVPTTRDIMLDFLNKKISEKKLLKQTKPGHVYDCLYLCSATTLPEYRGKGETKKLCLATIEAIQKTHPIKTLFVWPFTKGGDRLSEAIARECDLELLKLKE